jgi:hypothetical protein
VTPVVRGRPVQEVSVPEEGVPRAGAVNVGVVSVGDVARTPEPVPVVVIASSAVAPELTAMISEPFPASVGMRSKASSIAANSDRIADDRPAAPVLGAPEAT